MAKKLTKKQVDNLINKVYTKNCCNIQINMMDIPKIFAEGRKAIEEGRDLDQAIVAFVETIRVDKPKLGSDRDETHAEYIERRDGKPEYAI